MFPWHLFNLLWNAHSSEFFKPFLIALNSFKHCRFCTQNTVSLIKLKKSKLRIEKTCFLNSLKSWQSTEITIDNKIKNHFEILAIAWFSRKSGSWLSRLFNSQAIFIGFCISMPNTSCLTSFSLSMCLFASRVNSCFYLLTTYMLCSLRIVLFFFCIEEWSSKLSWIDQISL